MYPSVANYSFASTNIVPGISCDTIRCGTSRVIVLVGEELPQTQDLLVPFLHKLLMGEQSPADGLKGEHYQSNKVAIIYPGNWPAQVKFLFYQLDPRTEQLVPNMECANLSVGAGMVALLKGISYLDENGSLYAYNIGTGQHIELIPHNRQYIWSCDWTVRFLMGIPVETMYSQAHFESIPANESENVDCWIMEQGNVFAFVNAHPDVADPTLVDIIENTAKNKALALGMNPLKSVRPKIIFYTTSEADFYYPTVEACCFFESEKHKSLPGSGSMCLASFLTTSLLRENGIPSPFGSIVFNIKHPSGSLEVSVNWATINNSVIINSTGFETSAKLLLRGSFTV